MITVPDYKNSIKIKETPYKTEENGFILFVNKNPDWTGSYIPDDGTDEGDKYIFPVNKGDVISQITYKTFFIPVKTVNR
jgi:hypothetical protein